jgi:hypothetical protein
MTFLLAVLTLASPAASSILVELSFREKMDAADVVIVGTVTSAIPGHPDEFDATATVLTLATLKGTPAAQHIVFTQSRIAEDQLQCCEVGASYVMFLRHVPDRAELASVNGRHGMVRIGRATSELRIEVVPDPGQ